MSVVLVATNGSRACRRAVARAAELFGDDAFLVATVVACGRAGGAPADGDRSVRAIADDLALDAGRVVLAEACRTLGARARPVLLTGDPIDALVRAVRRAGARTLVVGSLGGGPFADVLGPSVGAALARRAPCSVLELG